MHQKEQIIKTVETEEAIVGLRKDGILHVYYKPNTELDVLIQTKLLNVYNEITNKKKTPFIFEAGEYFSVTKEARDYSIKLEPLTPMMGIVVFVQNPIYKLIANFYYKVNKPKVPYKIVENFDEGIRWLLALKKRKEG